MSEYNHIPVLLQETVQILAPIANNAYLDVTLGLGGHAKEILSRIGPNGTFVGIDADAENLEEAKKRLQRNTDNTTYIHANFLEIPTLGLEKFDCILADLGMSSPHIDDPLRGFTFQKDVPLDMRFNRQAGDTAAQLIRKLSESDLADVMYYYAELRQSRRLAAVLKKGLPETTGAVIECLERNFSYRGRDLLPQVFQALRIAVNSELDALNILLEHAPNLLEPNGKLAIISFHSLEDRRIKQCFKKLCTPEIDQTTGQITVESPFIPILKKAVQPTSEEITRNPRARSAKLRAIQKRVYTE